MDAQDYNEWVVIESWQEEIDVENYIRAESLCHQSSGLYPTWNDYYDFERFHSDDVILVCDMLRHNGEDVQEQEPDAHHLNGGEEDKEAGDELVCSDGWVGSISTVVEGCPFYMARTRVVAPNPPRVFVCNRPN